MLLPFDDTSDMWRVSVNYISCCCRWWRRHQIRHEIMSNVRDISHITSQILQIYEFAEPDQNPDQTVLVRFGFFTFTGSVLFEFYIFFCMSVLVRFGSAKMWVLVRFVRFEFDSIPISTNLSNPTRTWVRKFGFGSGSSHWWVRFGSSSMFSPREF